jgi:DNA polymerase-3 subunit gamma/tau
MAGLGEMHDSGADPLVILQDLLELTHWVTRLKVAPEAAAASADSERAQGLALAAKLSMASLTRAWTLLLKGLQETLSAPSPLRAAEMALIRLCYAADLPSPSDAIKALQNGAGPAANAATAPAAAPRGGGGGAAARTAAQPMTAALAQPAEVPPAPLPNPKSFTEIVALFEAKREARVVHHLMHHVHEVRSEPGLIEFRPEPQAPTDLAARLSEMLGRWTGRRWIASVSSDPGKPTLSAQKAANADSLRSRAEADPLVQAILKTFPGAKLDAVRRKGDQSSLVAGLIGAGDEPAASEEYPADDDIPESEF